jgi:DNA modification methylase
MMMTEEIRPLEIKYEKICDCPPSHINCLTAKEWTQAQVAIWEFYYNGKDIRDKDVHPAVFPIGLPKKCIQLFTHEGELVVDPFVGSGTTLIAALETNRNAVGFDLKKEYVELSNGRIPKVKLASFMKDLPPEKMTQQIAIHAEAHDIPKYLNKEGMVSLFVTSPPYANMLNRPRTNKSLRGNLRQNRHYLKVQQYSADERDLGTMEPKKYARVLGEIYKNLLPLLKPKGHSVINVTDLWSKEVEYGERIPVHLYVIEEMQKAGYELRNIIIWDRRNLVNQVGIFGWPNNYITFGTTFEYILDFWRPPPEKEARK